MAEVTKNDLLFALWGKFQALYDFLQEMNARLKPSQRPDHDGVILNAELEIERVKQSYDMIKYDAPIPFPSEEQVRALAQATGELQKVVGVNQSYERMADAAVGLITTWPVSDAG